MVLDPALGAESRGGLKVMERAASREKAESLLRAARFLPPEDRKLIRDFFRDGASLRQIAAKLQITPTRARRRIRAVRRRVADPCFLLAVQFAFRLPQPLRELANLHFRCGVPLAGCAATLGMSLHHLRQSLRTARTLLVIAGVNKYGGSDENRRALIAAALAPRPPGKRFQPMRLRRCAASA